MRPRSQSVAFTSEAGEFADQLRQLLGEIGRAGGTTLTGECSPPLDVYETDHTIEIAMDLPGVEATAVRIVAKGDAVLIVGEKTPRRGRGDSSFHLVERGYGRFARVARLTSACGTRGAHATLIGGELRVSLPKVKEQRGHAIPIAITTEHPIA